MRRVGIIKTTMVYMWRQLKHHNPEQCTCKHCGRMMNVDFIAEDSDFDDAIRALNVKGGVLCIDCFHAAMGKFETVDLREWRA